MALPDAQQRPDHAPPDSSSREEAGHYKRAQALDQHAARPVGEVQASLARDLASRARRLWSAPAMLSWRAHITAWSKMPMAGMLALVGGTVTLSLLIAGFDRVAVAPLPSPGLVYLPLVAMLAYHWGWRHAVVAGLAALTCVYFLFIPPYLALKSLSARPLEQVLTLAVVMAFVLALVQLARARRALAEHEAGRFAALNAVGAALARELDEQPLLSLIARTACELTGAGFAAFTLRPLDELGQPTGPAEGSLFHLAAVVGVTPEQEALFRRMPLGGEGLLAPIFREGVPVRISDALQQVGGFHGEQFASQGHHSRDHARGPAHALASDTAHTTARGSGPTAKGALHAPGVPQGHPIVRSFLGAPLLDRSGQVHGGLLLGHTQPGHFSAEDESLLVGLAAQAAVALENARLYRAAQTQAQELDAIFESIGDGIALVDEQGQVRRENAAARRLREQILANGFNRDTLIPLVGAVAQQALREEPPEMEGPLPTQGPPPVGSPTPGVPVAIADRHGDIRHYLISASPLRSRDLAMPGPQTNPASDDTAAGSGGGAVVVIHDVTEARRLDEERHARAEADERRALLQTVIEEMPSGIYLVRGDDARLVLANRAAEMIWGSEWPRGMPMAEFLSSRGVRILGPAGSALGIEELATIRAVRSGAAGIGSSAIRHLQEVICQPGGVSLPVLLNAAALDARLVSWPEDASPGSGLAADLPPSAEAAERGALVVLQDVSSLKEAERLKDEFIAIAAHELRNPMAAIKGYAQMLTSRQARGKGGALDEWQREALETIDASTSRLVELTDDLLDVTRLQAGRLELHLAPVDLVALARRVARRLQVTAPNHTLAVTAERDAIMACVDVQRVEQVLGNLLNNAVKYSPDGGPIDVALDVCDEQGMAKLSIRDSGIGIPAAEQSRIFARFVRAENARARGIGGTGLGLYLCRELVERHSGRIWFESAEGQGTTFHLTLPLAREVEDEAAEVDRS
jgi:two-component system, OmpR family, phosphate regulon sensor histidine kinase PhoR